MNNAFKIMFFLILNLFAQISPAIAADPLPQTKAWPQEALLFFDENIALIITVVTLLLIYSGIRIRKHHRKKKTQAAKLARETQETTRRRTRRTRTSQSSPLLEKSVETTSQQASKESITVSPTSSPDPNTEELIIQADASRLPTKAPLIGQKKYKAVLDDCLANPQVAVTTLIAAAGVGKTVLLKTWVQGLESRFTHQPKLFFWSFYGQDDHKAQGCSTLFFSKALSFFGHNDALPNSAEERARYLSERLKSVAEEQGKEPSGQKSILLCLDGVESLQLESGHFADPGLNHLMRFLLHAPLEQPWENSLIVISSRRSIAESAAMQGTLCREILLGNMREKESTQLLHELGIKGKFSGFRSVAKTFYGHPLALTLAGRLLSKYHGGNIANKNRLSEIFAATHTATATSSSTEKGAKGTPPDAVQALIQQILAYYDTFLWPKTHRDAKEGQGYHQVFLRLSGLFDRPMEEELFQMLCQEAVVAQPLRDMDPGLFQTMLTDLQEAGIVQTTLGQDGTAQAGEEDHPWPINPLINNYFGQTLFHENPDGWRQAHHLLAVHFSNHLSQKLEARPMGVEALETLNRSIHHACLAGEFTFALKGLYQKRLRKSEKVLVSTQHTSDRCGFYLAALSGFFPNGWHAPPVNAGLTPQDQSWLVAEVAACLKSLGRVVEAANMQREQMRMTVESNEWQDAPTAAVNLCALLLPSGALQEARTTAEYGITWAEQSTDPFRQMVLQTLLATAQHQLGEMTESLTTFQAAEEAKALLQPETPRLTGLQGKYYCDLLLEQAQERADLTAILERVEKYFCWHNSNDSADSAQDNALNHLIFGRVLADLGRKKEAREQLDQAVSTIRNSIFSHFMAEILLYRAVFLRQNEASAAARRDLQESLAISTRSGLRLFETDGRLLEGHMLLDDDNPDNARKALERAETLITELSYDRSTTKAQILRARLLHQQGNTTEANVWRQQAEKQIEEKSQWGLLSHMGDDMSGM